MQRARRASSLYSRRLRRQCMQCAVAGVEAGDEEGEREADKAGRSEAGGTAGKGQRAGKQRGG